jgi:hypothetical protein
MNVFWLDRSVDRAASAVDDSRVVKLCTEAAQCVAAGLRIRARDPLSPLSVGRVDSAGVYEAYNIDNALPHWCALSRSHMLAVWHMTQALNDEYVRRWDDADKHGSWAAAVDWFDLVAEVPDHGWHAPPLYMPDEYKGDDFVEAYRRYYVQEKGSDVTFERTDRPEWWEEYTDRTAVTV